MSATEDIESDWLVLRSKYLQADKLWKYQLRRNKDEYRTLFSPRRYSIGETIRLRNYV